MKIAQSTSASLVPNEVPSSNVGSGQRAQSEANVLKRGKKRVVFFVVFAVHTNEVCRPGLYEVPSSKVGSGQRAQSEANVLKLGLKHSVVIFDVFVVSINARRE